MTKKETDRGPTHDSSYKLLYSHVAMVGDLLQGFIPGAWVEELDLTTLEKCSGSYVSDDLRDRADDLIWRVRWNRDWLYVYLLLEFQSSIDRWMAVRVQTYLGLLYQDLIRTQQLSSTGRLPPVLPIVLYNGASPWNAACALDDLIEPAPPVLREYRPQQAYFLIDEQRVAEQGNLPQRNLSAALFRLEASRTPAEVLTILHALVEWLAAPEQTGLRRAFTIWFNRVFLPKRLAGVEFESMTDLHEVHDMLSNRVESWTEQWKREGLTEGRKEGRKEGLEQGLERGRQETRHLLARQACHRFGSAIATQTEPLLTAIADPRQLADLGDALLSCPDGTAWLRVLHQVRSPSTTGDEHP